MTKEEIIIRAKQLGFPRLSKKSHDNQATMIATIVAEAVLLEREACAKVCENQLVRQDIDVRDQCSAAIRARGEPTSRGEA